MIMNNCFSSLFAVVLLAFLVFAAIPSSAQIAVQDAAGVLQRIDKANSGISSLTGNFVQTKKSSMVEGLMTSRGRLCMQDGNVRWEYTSPDKSVCIIKGEEVFLVSGGGVRQMNANAAKGFQGIAKIIGSAGSLSSGKDFSVEVFEAGNSYLAVLTPLGRDLKRMFSSVRLFFGDDLRVAKIELNEASGDKTTISLSDLVYNGPVSASEFETGGV